MEKEQIRLRAMAKINLGLDVLRRREDGYHDLRMIMQNVRLYDEVIVSAEKNREIKVYTNLSFLPTDRSNLVYKAAQLMQDEYPEVGGVSIQLNKRIPVAAGLAGGSSDAAAVMVGINRMYSLHKSVEELMKLGVRIGADVPYCILRGTALSEGIGDVLTSLPPMPACSIVLAKPAISVSTKFVYENLKLTEDTVHPDIDGIADSIREGNLKGITDRLGNVLETVTAVHFPVIEDIKAEMVSDGAMASLMSGSGPTVFGIFDDREKAQFCKDKLLQRQDSLQVYLTEPFCVDR